MKTDLTPSVVTVFIVSTKVDTYQKHRETVEGGALWVCGVSAAWMLTLTLPLRAQGRRPCR